MQAANTPTPVDYTTVPIHAPFLQTAQQQGLDNQAQAVEHHTASGTRVQQR